MTAGARHRVWFERTILPDLLTEVEAAVQVLGPPLPDDALRDFDEAEGVVASVYAYDGAVMDRAPQLRVIARTGIGYDKVDLDAATDRGIAVCNTPDGPTVSTAEHTVALVLVAAKDIKRSEHELRAGCADLYARHAAVELHGKVLGLVGYGRIARRVGAALGALGMEVHVFDPFLPDDAIPPHVTRHADRDSLLAEADVVSVHVPLTPGSAGSFDTAAFAVMKTGATFVNTARGGLVDQAALLAALDDGRLRAAALDVTDPEPLPVDHPLLHRNDVVVTPHVASGTVEGKRRIFRTALAQVIQVLNGWRPDHLVNAEVWDRIGVRRGTGEE